MTDPIKALIEAGEAVADALRDIAGDGHRAYLDAWESAIAAAEARPEPAPDDAARDWPEDFAHENGNYMVLCRICQQWFNGYKRRVACKVCATQAARPEPAAEPSTFDHWIKTALDSRSVGDADSALACIIKALKMRTVRWRASSRR